MREFLSNLTTSNMKGSILSIRFYDIGRIDCSLLIWRHKSQNTKETLQSIFVHKKVL